MTTDLSFQQTEIGARVEGAQRWEVVADGSVAGLQVRRHGLYPWLRVARIPRFGRGSQSSGAQLISRAMDVAKARGAVHLSVEVWNENADARAELAALLLGLGFQPSERPRSYRYTIWLDLLAGSDEEALLSTFHATCRRHIRAPEKRGYEVRPVGDVEAASRMASLIKESFGRRAKAPPPIEWSQLLDAAGTKGSRVRVAGMFPKDSEHPRDMVAFAVAYLHGDVAEYAHAGATRQLSGLPLHYAPTWHLMKWARTHGARFWDFGGVRAPDDDESDGIGDFKQRFGGEVTEVGQEWVIPLRPNLHRVATALKTLMRRS